MDNLKDKKKEVLSGAIKNIKLQDAGVKDKKTDTPVVSSSNSNKVRYPTLYLNTKECPQLADHKFGDKIIMIVEGEITGQSKNVSMNNDRESFDIQIKKIGVQKKGK